MLKEALKVALYILFNFEYILYIDISKSTLPTVMAGSCTLTWF